MAINPAETAEDAGTSVQPTAINQSDVAPGEPYLIKAPIPIKLIQEGALDFTAAFDEAGILIGGEGRRDAVEALANELLDVFDYFTKHEAELGPEPQRQLSVLRKYIGSTNDQPR
jgi:hypothetical protein